MSNKRGGSQESFGSVYMGFMLPIVLMGMFMTIGVLNMIFGTLLKLVIENKDSYRKAVQKAKGTAMYRFVPLSSKSSPYEITIKQKITDLIYWGLVPCIILTILLIPVPFTTESQWLSTLKTFSIPGVLAGVLAGIYVATRKQ